MAFALGLGSGEGLADYHPGPYAPPPAAPDPPNQPPPPAPADPSPDPAMTQQAVIAGMAVDKNR